MGDIRFMVHFDSCQKDTLHDVSCIDGNIQVKCNWYIWDIGSYVPFEFYTEQRQ